MISFIFFFNNRNIKKLQPTKTERIIKVSSQKVALCQLKTKMQTKVNLVNNRQSGTFSWKVTKNNNNHIILPTT